jgi:hypothetical protein
MRFSFRSALPVVILAWAAPLAGQTCTTPTFSGSIYVADGSTAPSQTVELCGNRLSPEPGWACGNVTLASAEVSASGGTWEYSARHPNYLETPYYPGSDYEYDADPPHCLVGSGGFSIPLYASNGNIRGTVRGRYDEPVYNISRREFQLHQRLPAVVCRKPLVIGGRGRRVEPGHLRLRREDG